MRYSDLENKLEEAVRFSNAEKAFIEPYKDDFKIGIEYEFELDKNSDGLKKLFDEYTESFSKSYKSFEEMDNGVKEYILVTIYSEEYDRFDELYSFLKLMKDVVGFNLPNDIREEDLFVAQLFDKVFGTDFFSVLEHYKDGVDVGSLREQIVEFFGKSESKYISTYRLFTLMVERGILSDRIEEEFNNFKEREIERLINIELSGEKTFTPIGFIRKNIQSYLRHPDYLRGVEKDGSLKYGGEVITEPMPVDIAIKFSEDVFKFIKKYGYTADNTGLHVNLSHKSFSEIQNIDFLKFLILHDTILHQNDTLKNIIKQSTWLERNNMVANIDKKLNRKAMRDILVKAPSSGSKGTAFMEYLISELRKLFISTEKFVSINFRNTFNVMDEDRRIELRYPGGEGYENRLEDLENTIYYSMYTLLAALDKDFLVKEYYRGIIRLLNRKSKYYTDMDFFDLYAGYKKGEVDLEEVLWIDE